MNPPPSSDQPPHLESGSDHSFHTNDTTHRESVTNDSLTSQRQPRLTGITNPTKEQWLSLFQEAGQTSAKEVCRNNPGINYATFCTRQTKFKQNDLDGATMPIGKPGRPSGGGGSKRKRKSSRADSDDDSSESDMEPSFGNASRRITGYRGDDNMSNMQASDNVFLSTESNDQLDQHDQHDQHVEQQIMPEPRKQPTVKKQKVQQSITPPFPTEHYTLLDYLNNYEQRREREITAEVQAMRSISGSVSSIRAAELLDKLEKSEIDDMREEVAAAREAVLRTIQARAASNTR